MKKILKISSLAFLLITAIACENDDQTIATAKGGPQLITPASGTEYVLSPANADNEVTTLVWNHADYDVQTAINYEVQVALTGTDFATVVSGGTTTNRFLTWTVAGLNQVALDAGLTPYTAGDLDVRVKSSLGDNGDLVNYSNTITLKVTPYTTELPKLAVPGDHQGWTPGTAPRLASSGFGKTDYEGYVWLQTEFKFVEPDGSGNFAWGNVDWGDDGSFSGTLVSTGESNCTVAAAGYYRLKANTGAVSATNSDGLTWSATPTVWGIVGAATPGGWGASTALTYNSTSKKWQGIVALTAGEYKFRANDAWTINLGGYDATKPNTGENMSYDGPNLSVASAGNYLVELDLSNPRAYTYTLTPQ